MPHGRIAGCEHPIQSHHPNKPWGSIMVLREICAKVLIDFGVSNVPAIAVGREQLPLPRLDPGRRANAVGACGYGLHSAAVHYHRGFRSPSLDQFHLRHYSKSVGDGISISSHSSGLVLRWRCRFSRLICKHKPVGSRTGEVFRRSSLAIAPRFLWECLSSQTANPFPAPATSHPACGFSALGAPVCLMLGHDRRV
jgi:hypothetical protein